LTPPSAEYPSSEYPRWSGRFPSTFPRRTDPEEWDVRELIRMNPLHLWVTIGEIKFNIGGGKKKWWNEDVNCEPNLHNQKFVEIILLLIIQ
jgi:hypothetical protein